MVGKLKFIAGSFVLIGGLAFAAYADPHQSMPASPSGDQSMMGGSAAKMQMTPEMAQMMQKMPPEMMQQMTRMMENCNRMMESHMQQQPPACAPLPEKKG